MHHRVLIKQQGLQSKKRFVSPNQLKNYPNTSNSNTRLYSPSNYTYQSHRFSQNQAINQPNNNIQQKVAQLQINQQINEKSNASSSNYISKQSFFTHRPSHNKSKSGKKDYMMASLARFNAINKQQNSQIKDNQRSRSSSKNKDQIIKISAKEKKLKDQEYGRKNLYIQKDNYQNKNSQIDFENTFKKNQSDSNNIQNPKPLQNSNLYDEYKHKNINNKNSQQFNSLESNKLDQGHQSGYLNAYTSHLKNSMNNYNKEIGKIQSNRNNIITKNNINQIQQISKQQIFSKKTIQSSISQKAIQTSNNNLKQHLQKAHEQKQQLHSKKIKLQNQKKLLSQKLNELQNNYTQLKRQYQQQLIQKAQIMSQLKSLKLFENKTKYQLKDTNQRNQYIYKEINQKYQNLLKDQRKLISENQFQKKQNDKLTIEISNLQNRVKFSMMKEKNIQDNMNQMSEKHKLQIKNTINQWKNKVQQLESQLRKKIIGNQNIGNLTGNIKVKLIELQTDLSHKNQIIAKRQEQIKYLKAQQLQNTKALEQIVKNKQTQIKQLQNKLQKTQKNLQRNIFQYETKIKQIQNKIVKAEKQLQIKRLEFQQFKVSSQSKLNMSQAKVDTFYSTNMINSGSKQTKQAKSTFQQLISGQNQQIFNYKKQLNKKVQEVFSLKSQIQQLKSKNNNLIQQYKILQLQNSALQRKTQNQSNQLNSTSQEAVMRSKLQINERKLKQLQNKIEWKSKQIKHKDQFITNHLLRFTKQENVINLLNKLKQIGIGNNA